MEVSETLRKRGAPSKIDAFAHMIGKEPDADIAQRAGVTTSAVRQYRSRRGIPRVYRRQEEPAPLDPVLVRPAPYQRAYTVTIELPDPEGEPRSPRAHRTVLAIGATMSEAIATVEARFPGVQRIAIEFTGEILT